MRHYLLPFMILLGFFFADHVNIDAQNNNPKKVVVSGVVMDKMDKQPVPYATVSLSYIENGKEELFGQVCDGHGFFRIAMPYKETYYVDVSFVGKKFDKTTIHPKPGEKELKLDNLYLEDDESTNLKELQVVHKRALIKMDVDRLSYAMNEDIEAKKKNLFDMMKKVPLVTVDGKGNIQINGSGSYKFLINGKPSPMFDQDPKMILKTIPANTVKKVEVITEPGVKYANEGVSAVINIITDQRTGDGVMGTVSADASFPLGISSGIYLAMKKGKFGANANISAYSGSDPYSHTSSDFRNYTSNTRLYQTNDDKNKYLGGYGNILLSYEIDTLNLITLNSGFFPYYNKSVTEGSILSYKDDELLSDKKVREESKSVNGGINTSLDYQHSTRREGELLTLSYRFNYSPNKSDDKLTKYGELEGKDYRTWGKSDASMKEHTLQLDYTIPFGKKNEIESGLKYIHRYSFSNPRYRIFDYDIDEWSPYDLRGDKLSNSDFSQTYDIFTVYSAYSYRLKTFSAKAGIRAEWGRSGIEYDKLHEADFHKTYFDWIPEARISYRPSMMQQIAFSYGFRIRRPSIGQLNPYVSVVSPYMTREGNPALKPTKFHQMSLNYSLFTSKFQINLGSRFSFANNQIMNYYEIDGQDPNLQHYKYANIGKMRRAGASLYVSWSPKSWTRLSANTTYTYSYMKDPQVEKPVHGHSVYSFMGMSFYLPKSWEIDANGGFSYDGKGLQSTSSFYFWDSYTLSKSFKDDLWNVYITIQSPFRKESISKTTTTTPVSELISKGFQRTRGFSIGFSFDFGHLDSVVKRTQRSISNDDLSGGDEGGGGKSGK